MGKVKLLAFDLFGTIFNMADVPRDELRSYGEQIRRNMDPANWQPFELPACWDSLPIHADAIEGMRMLRERFVCVTFSNAPAALQVRMLRNAGVEFDAITPLECFQLSKPMTAIYPHAGLWGYPLSECGMVTANESFGDLEGAKACGMRPILIRGDEFPTLLELERRLA